MKFVVTRTSQHGTGKPMSDVKRETFTSVDRRTVSTLEEVKSVWWGMDFLSRGSNHREENGFVVRDCGTVGQWVIEVSSLDELLSLVDREGSVVIRREMDLKEQPFEIEIYDTYRE